MTFASSRTLLLLALLAGCQTTWKVEDVDDDGYTLAQGDCWESEAGPEGSGLTGADIHPEATETWYDGVDQDCAGQDVSDYDADGDGYTASGAPEGSADDCEDEHANAYPGGDETWYDGVDGDCLGGSDYDKDGDGADADGYGEGGDCDDDDSEVGPNATETWYDGIDQDCGGDDDFDADGDGSVVSADCDDEDASATPGNDEVWYDGVDGDCLGGDDYDADGDGYTVPDAPEGTQDDCDDTDPAINPDADEVWYDDVDGDCDGWDDFDADKDGYPSEAYGGTDCDDTWSEAHPNADEVCNLRDDDCDGTTDEGYEASDTITYYADADGDSYGDVSVVEYACEGYEPTGFVLNNDDCDDADGDDYPGATETVGNGDDEDCDGAESCYDDGDDDGYLDTSGDTRDSSDADCSDANEGTTSDPTTDCDDASASDHPGATETVGNGDDEDCDGKETCYYDGDDDGQLDTSGTTVTSSDTDCNDANEGKRTDPTTDCDDSAASVYDGASEVTGDEVDQDCDGAEICYDDDDDDGYLDTTGDTRASSDADCSDAYEATSSALTTDCDDASATDYPGATETVGNGDDEDCDGKETCYDDDDNDGYLDSSGDTRSSTDADCADSYEGLSSDPTTDCDDADADAYPGADETVGDGVDQDCDGGEVCYDDDDNDGYLDATDDTRTSSDEDCADANEGTSSDLQTDCDDSSATDYPGATETVGNGDDEDCDGAETCYDDNDNDGYLDGSGATRASSDTDCTDTKEGTNTDPTTDCNDDNGNSYPGAAETCEDGEVNDCTGTEADAIAECGVGGTVDLGAITDVFAGASASDGLGVGLAGGFNVDGDVYTNFLIAADTSDHSGIVYLLDGKTSDFGSNTVSSVDVAAFTAAGTGDYFGLDMAGGDLDGDGYDDIALGAAYFKNGTTSSNYGATYVLNGPISTGGGISSMADEILLGATSGDRAGAGVAILGDQDGDGDDELLIGTDGYDVSGTNAQGSAWIVEGPVTSFTLSLGAGATTQITGTSNNDLLGKALSSGDADGDGTSDALIGAASSSSGGKGRAYLLLGAVSNGTIAAADSDVIITGDSGGDHLGTALSGGGDLDNDGYDDVVVSAPNHKDGSDTDIGRAYVYFGAATWTASLDGSDADAILTGEAASDTAGTSISIAPDVDDDGADDLIIGAPGNDTAASAAGVAYLIYGPPTSITLDTADALLTGDAASDAAGTAVAGVGDTNNDGYGDLLIGATGADPSTGSAAGAVYLLQGSSY